MASLLVGENKMTKKISDFGVKFEHKILKNGSPLLLFKREGMPINIRAIFNAGARYDKKQGTAHFLEHMLVSGTEKFPTKNILARHIQQTGGEIRANMSTDLLRLMVEIPEKEDLDVAIEILNECLTKPLFNDSTIETERGAILSEMKTKRSNPKEYVWVVSQRLSMQGTPVANPVLGTEDSVKDINKEDLKSFFSDHITANNVSYIVSGDVDIAELASKLETIDLPQGEQKQKITALPIIRDKAVDIQYYTDTSQLQVVLANRTNIESFKEYCASKILNEILSVGKASRLMTKLRYERGLVYSISGSIHGAGDWRAMRIYFSCDKSNLQIAKDVIFSEFSDMRRNGINGKELEDIKRQITKSFVRTLQTSESWVEFHDNLYLYNPGSTKTIEDYLHTINEITPEDMKGVIEKYLKEENFYTAICGDYSL